MRRTREVVPLPASVLHDISTLAFLALFLVPFYLLLNQYWKSIVLLAAVYGLLAVLFIRLGRRVRRVMRRQPADIPPWYTAPGRPSATPGAEMPWGPADAIQSAYKDPHYLEDVLKPRLCQLLAYRLSGNLPPDVDPLDDAAWQRVDPAVRELLQQRHGTGLWMRLRHGPQRLRHVLQLLRYVEEL